MYRARGVPNPLKGLIDADEASWSSNDVCSLAGCSYRQLDYWVRTGRLHADVREARGSGSQREFSSRAVMVAWVLTQVGLLGISIEIFDRDADVLEQIIGFGAALLEVEVAAEEALDVYSLDSVLG